MSRGEVKTWVGAGRRGLHPPTAKRVMYGYCRVNFDRDRGKFTQYEHQMRDLAKRHGFELDRVFFDVTGQVPSVFEHLSSTLLQNEDVQHVVVPDLTHFSKFSFMQPMVVQYLNFLGVKVWVTRI